ncbi:MAG: glycosyltransferase family 2 protein [Candidatus Moranbacteria bacterium]|nr:glycosyltransferase family 2 protein [Candidatus Moranbacteria bacterium]
MPNFSKKLSVVIVNFNSADYLERCLASVFKNVTNCPDSEVLVIDNSDELSLEKLSRPYKISLIKPEKNIGFGSAANLGARNTHGEILLFLNPDTEVPPDFFSKALAIFQKRPDIAVLGPKILDENGKTQEWSVGREVNFWDLIGNNLGFIRSQKIWASGKNQKVDWVSGASLFIRREAFDSVGGFDENLFLYFEDIDLCRRVRRKKGKVAYFPRISVRHKGGRSFSSREAQKKYYYTSQDHYFKKHFGARIASWVRFLRKSFG